ncbi:hypothetical protein SAZ10_17400 [Mesorhizobium sp. BAC0120]|uniref:hypothetical protein n=1 Tax=Mesorhizobium sp. BAC0120 TaxID=3090670 RepID=UPI00298C11EF|nr:hypothetical protein [Mesorhizobium sp. BAC0120]MDW6023529.1 hypothetical protein [Mesorhizobium sp. BAC0120]
MSKFKDAVERAKREAGRGRDQQTRRDKAGRDASAKEFNVRAKAWLENIAIASLQAAKADVADEVTIDIDTAAVRAESMTPSIQFRLYRTPKGDEKHLASKTYTVAVQVDGGVSVCAPGIVSKDAGVIADESAERFTTLLAELIADAAKG